MYVIVCMVEANQDCIKHHSLLATNTIVETGGKGRKKTKKEKEKKKKETKKKRMMIIDKCLFVPDIVIL